MTFDLAFVTQNPLVERLIDRFGRRTLGIVAAIVAELLIILLLLTLGRGEPPPKPPLEAVTAFDVSAPKPEQPQAEAEAAKPEPSQAASSSDRPQPVAPAPPQRKPALTLPDVPLAQPSAPAPEPQPSSAPPQRPKPQVKMGAMQGPMLGATASSISNDTPLVGTAPDGQPMYAARWYREPTHDELAGYLSTASGPGWGMIACKTAPQFRVENCVALGESPQGSNIDRAILAAAWQFKVRPPRIGGRSLVGSWVRIRIDYTQRGA